jgi:hypothetical protein
MTFLKPAALGVALLVLAAGSAFAQTPMASHDAMMSGMSKHDTMMMQHCQGMSHDAMMKSHSCMKMMKMHPDMMQGHMSNSGGAMTH